MILSPRNNFDSSFGSQISLEVGSDEFYLSESDESGSDSEVEFDTPEVFGPVKGFPEFENLDVMTLTLIGRMNGKITDLEVLFHLIPWIKIKWDKPAKDVDKYVIPWPGYPGVIASIGYKNMKRGIVTSWANAWPHSVCIRVSNSTKMIACKICKDSIHMTGCKTTEMGVETAKIVLTYINNVFGGLKSLQELPEERIKYIIRDCLYQGSYFKTKKVDEDVEDSGGVVKILRKVLVQRYDANRIKIPPGIPEKERLVYNLFYGATSDLNTPKLFSRKIRWILTSPKFTESPMEFDSLDEGLIKFNFNLGFKVDLDSLNELFREIDKSFYTDYYARTRQYVKIERAMEMQTSKARKKKDVIDKHSFTVKHKGQVQYSCPCMGEMRDVYYRFIWVLSQIKEVIIDKEDEN